MPTTGTTLLRTSIRSQHGVILASSGLLLGYQAGEAVVPVLVGVIVDRAIATGSHHALYLWLGVLLGTFLVRSICWRYGVRLATRAGVEADRSMRVAVVSRLLDSRGMDGERPAGELMSVATADIRRTTAVNFLLPYGVAAVVGAIVAGVALLLVSLPLGLLILAGTPLLLLLVRVLSRPLESKSTVQQEESAQAVAIATDLMRGLRVLKGLRIEEAGARRYRRSSRTSLHSTLRNARAEAAYTAAVLAANGVFLAVVALVGGRLAAAGDITIGQLVSAVALTQFLLTPLTTFGQVAAVLAAGRASAKRVAELLSAPAGVQGGTGRLTRTPRRMVLTGIHGPGLHGVDLAVTDGELLGVLATDPVAALTLCRYLGRDADPPGGDVTLDGVPLRDLEPAELRRAVLVCPHDPDLFTGTVEENVRSGGADALESALAAARADQVAQALPSGLATVISERGRSLSGGQRQRVALARALARDPEVLVLHDPTTAVDTVTESAIGAALRDLRAGRTTIVVTTSPSLLAVTDRVAFLDRGVIAAVGSHERLVRENARYRGAV